MTLNDRRRTSVLLAVLAAASVTEHYAFVPSSLSRRAGGQVSTRVPPPSTPHKPTTTFHMPSEATSPTLLRFSQELFQETKYTEAAWAAVAGLTSAADYYKSTTLEAPLLLDMLLNPSKHGTGGDQGAVAAKKVTEKTLNAAGVDLKTLRSGLETYLGKQPKVTGNVGQKTMGRSLQKTLETARDGSKAFGVSSHLTIHG